MVFGEYYSVSVNVKATDKISQFGLRLISKYPNRVDAIFDIDKGSLKSVITTGYFENGSATIEPLKDGWYKCTIKVQPNSEKLEIIFGPTSDEKNVIGWEGKTAMTGEIYLVPSSLTLEEIIE